MDNFIGMTKFTFCILTNYVAVVVVEWYHYSLLAGSPYARVHEMSDVAYKGMWAGRPSIVHSRGKRCDNAG